MRADSLWFIVYRKRILKAMLLLAISYSLLVNICFAQEEKFFEIRAKKFSYTPNIIKVNIGDKVKIRLLSEDVHHGFFLDGYGVETSAHPGQEGYVEFVANRSGRFSFRCSVTCGEFHPYMVGYLIVRPNRRFWGFTILILILGFGILLMHLRSKGIENAQG